MRLKKKGSLRNDLNAVIIPLSMILIGFGILIGIAVLAWVMGVFFALAGAMIVFFGALFALQIIPPRGWFGMIIGAVLAVAGLLVVYFVHQP